MYAIAVLRYRKPLEQVLEVVDDHRAYLQDLKRKGWLLASGPLDPRNGRRSLRGDGDGAVRDLAVAAEHRERGSRSAVSARAVRLRLRVVARRARGAPSS